MEELLFSTLRPHSKLQGLGVEKDIWELGQFHRRI